jgi:hypothetical protein
MSIQCGTCQTRLTWCPKQKTGGGLCNDPTCVICGGSGITKCPNCAKNDEVRRVMRDIRDHLRELIELLKEKL